MSKITKYRNLHLSDAINEFYPEWTEVILQKNLLINSPVGSGKSYFCIHHLFTDVENKYLFLTDTTNLKKSVIKNIKKAELTNVKVMTYSEFGRNLIELADMEAKALEYTEWDLKIYEYIEQYSVIVADECHNIIEFNRYKSKEDETEKGKYYYALRYLIKKYENTKVVFLSATPEKLQEFNETQIYRNNWNVLKNFHTYTFTKEEHEIKYYKNRRVGYFNNQNQILTEIKHYKEWIKYGNYNCIIYIQNIENMKNVANMLNDALDWIYAVPVWSLNASKKMNEEQKQVLDSIIKYGIYPDFTNCVILNDATLTGIDILEEAKVDLVICCSSDYTKIKQFRGRIRSDVDLLVFYENDSNRQVLYEDNGCYNQLTRLNEDEFFKDYINKDLTVEDLNNLIEEYKLFNKKARIFRPASLIKELETLGYRYSYRIVEEHKIYRLSNKPIVIEDKYIDVTLIRCAS